MRHIVKTTPICVFATQLYCTDLQETLDPLPRRHDDGGHHPGQGPGGRQLRRPEHLTLPLLQLLSDPESHEADGEGRDGDDYGRPHACKQWNELFWQNRHCLLSSRNNWRFI